MSPPFGPGEVRDLTAEEVAAELAADRILLVDVREPRETAVERIPGSVLLPLSAFDPAAIPDPDGRDVVFSCATGRRSVRASPTTGAPRSRRRSTRRSRRAPACSCSWFWRRS